ncbi:hypothetical protein SAMN02745126_02748 [Enhydrobacter aerosaccus]|uniref:DUF962 domain-containing protein n=1 Tax=Enhydrobacter aerosaccus TaxID=225324 RepID=A0A1T4PCZ2_9HYPH|nr:DUF962 domain-containing protein [Enhydrobacter aerosaccus]SJZ89382.1 hypothetical protein SAMN02745126_02748 [Enhydrobacter aerosaccus]
MKIQTYREFWPYYLDQHRHATTRAIHYVGAASFIGFAIAAAVTLNAWLLVPAFALFYLPAWVAHFVIEGNRPATWAYPIWSFVSDLRMFAYWLVGRLSTELHRTRQQASAAAHS